MNKYKELRIAKNLTQVEFARLINVDQSTISKWCRDGLIPNATQDKPNSPWHIPKNAICPRKIKRS